MTANPTNSSTMPLKPGDRLDKYEVREQIGAGGMAVVLKGYDALLDRYVAIKQINAELSSGPEADDFLERFRREAKLQRRAALNHKHLVTLIDVIEESRGLFIIQEYVDGASLEQVLTMNPRPMEPRQALGIVGAAALALEAIHAKGIIHRDLKPSNILLPREGGLKVGDFGLAAMIAEQDAMSLGSVRYMAPELFRGDEVDGRADIYALGMIAYEMLAGRAAFNDAFKIVLRDQRNQALRWMKWHTNPRTKAPPLNQVNPDLSETLSDLVARMMEKDASQRIASAQELIEAIRRHFTPGADPSKKIHAPQTPATQAGPVIASGDTAPLPTPSRLPWVLAALVAINVLIGGGVWAWSAREAARQTAQERKEVLQVLHTAQGHYDQGQFAQARDLYEQVNQAWADDAEFGRTSLAGVLMSQAQLEFERGNYMAAINHIDEADALGVIRNRDRLMELKRSAQEFDAFDKEYRLIEQQIQEGRFTEARFNLNQQRRLPHPPKLQERLEELAQRIEGTATQLQIDQQLARARELVAAGRRDEAIQHLQQSLATLQSGEMSRYLDELRGEVDYEAALAEAARAEMAGDLGRAAEMLTRALQRRNDPQIQRRLDRVQSRAAFQEGQQALMQRDTRAAEEAFLRALGHDPEYDAARDALSRIATTDQKIGFIQAGDSAMNARDFVTAIRQYENALQLGDDAEVSGKLREARVRLHVSRGRQMTADGRLDEARTELEAALRLSSDDAPALAAMDELSQWRQYHQHMEAGDAARRAGRFGDAKRAYFRARDIFATDQIRDRIDDIEYESMVAQAQAEMAAERWTSAQAVLRTLMGIRPTEQVQRMLAEVNRKLGTRE